MSEQKPEGAIMEAIELANSVSEQINKVEEDCLKRVFCRFCLSKGLLVDFAHVGMRDFEDKHNYWEWWFKLGMKDQYFLMSRELTVEVKDGVPEPKLTINYNPELVVNNEL